MKYQYNYSFLSRWMEANDKININTILQAIGSTSNNSLRLWEQGRCPMPVLSILRFCIPSRCLSQLSSTTRMATQNMCNRTMAIYILA